MTKAQQLRKAVLEADCVYLSMKDNYGSTHDGKRFNFIDVTGEQPKETGSNYNKMGKCVKYTCTFSDKSKLIYTFNTRHNQFKLAAK